MVVIMNLLADCIQTLCKYSTICLFTVIYLEVCKHNYVLFNLRVISHFSGFVVSNIRGQRTPESETYMTQFCLLP